MMEVSTMMTAEQGKKSKKSQPIETNKRKVDSPRAPPNETSTASSKKRMMKKKKRLAAHRRRHRNVSDAPFNSTSFIIDDHSDTIQYLDRSLGVGTNPPKSKRMRLESTSSLGDDSNEEFYSSPSDEEDFVNKEFLKDYNSVRSDRLVSMSKGDLINEYMQMESRIEYLEKRLTLIRDREEAIQDKVDYDFKKGEIPMSPEIAEKIRVFQREIHVLEVENHALRRENYELKCKQQQKSDTEDSSSDSSSSDSDSDDSDNDDNTLNNTLPPSKKSKDGSSSSETAHDTGYESSHSHQIPPILPQENQPEEEEAEEEDDDDSDHVPDFISDNAVSSTSP